MSDTRRIHNEPKNSKRNKSIKAAGAEESIEKIRKPGAESGFPHIATMMKANGNMEVADQLVHGLFPHLQDRVLRISRVR